MPKSNKNYPSLLNTLGFSSAFKKKDSDKKDTKTYENQLQNVESQSTESQSTNSQTTSQTANSQTTNSQTTNSQTQRHKSKNSKFRSDEESTISPTLIEELSSVHNSDLKSTHSQVISKSKKKFFKNLNPSESDDYKTDDLLKSEFIDKKTEITNYNITTPSDILNKIIYLFNEKTSLTSIDKEIYSNILLLKEKFNLNINNTELNDEMNSLSLTENDIGCITQTQLSPISETTFVGGDNTTSFTNKSLKSKKNHSNFNKKHIITPKHKI